MVGTGKSPGGQAVPIGWVQDAIDLLVRDGAVEVTVEAIGHRSAFVGAVLVTLPGAVVEPTTPRRVTFRTRAGTWKT